MPIERRVRRFGSTALRTLAVVAVVVASAALPSPAEDAAWVREEFAKRLGRGISALKKGDATSAVADLCWAARRGLNSERANLYCGRALMAARQPDRSLRHLELATELAPQNLGAWVSLGDAYLASGRVDKSRAAFFEALELRSDHSPAYDGLARLAYQTGNEELALENYNKALEANPTDARARLHRGQLHLEAERYDQAIDDIREAARLRPDDAEVQLGFSRILLINGLSNQALTAARKAQALEPLSARVPAHIAEIYLTLRAFTEAEELARLALDRDPHLARARLVLAEVYGRTDRLGRALEILVPPDATFLRAQERELLAKATAKWTERQAALAKLEERAGNTEATPLDLLDLAEALVETGRVNDGVELAARAVSTGGDGARILRRAARIYFAADRPLETAELLERVDELGEATSDDIANLGTALELTGAPELAEKAYLRAISSPSPPPSAYGGLARLALDRGDNAAAVGHLVDFLAANPPSDEATRATEALARLSGGEEAPASSSGVAAPDAEPASEGDER